MANQTTQTILRGWKETTLGKVAEKIAMGPFGSNIKIETFVDSGVPVISGTHLNGLKLEDKEYNFITEEHAENLKSANVFRGDVIFTHAGNIGQVAFISKNSKYKKYILSQRQFYLRCDKEKLLSEFIVYYFKTWEGQHKLLANVNQTGVPSITQPVSYLKSISLSFPSLPEQRAVVAVLSSLDDKIELLREQNKTFEATAQAIFKEWFVDFKFPDHKKVKMIDSELGKIPEGWRVGIIDDLCERLTSGGTPSTDNDEYWEGDINWFSTKELQDNYLFESEKKITKVALNNSSAKMFPKGSVLMAIYAAPTVGRLGILGIDSTFNQAACGFVADDKITCNEYIYLLLLHLRNNFNNLANGAAQQNLNVGLVKNFSTVIPEKKVMEKFRILSVPIFEKIFNNSSQIQTLSKLRDTLLPKLMKGEVRVKGFNE